MIWFEQDADPLPEMVPLAHAVHPVDPLTDENVLAGHDEHDMAPDDDMVPATHRLLTAGVVQYEPAEHGPTLVEPLGQ